MSCPVCQSRSLAHAAPDGPSALLQLLQLLQLPSRRRCSSWCAAPLACSPALLLTLPLTTATATAASALLPLCPALPALPCPALQPCPAQPASAQLRSVLLLLLGRDSSSFACHRQPPGPLPPSLSHPPRPPRVVSPHVCVPVSSRLHLESTSLFVSASPSPGPVTRH